MPQPFHDALRMDPLFALEGADLEEAARTLDLLEVRIATLQRALTAPRPFLQRAMYACVFAYFPLNTNAFPMPFLRALVHAERSRRAYIAESTVERARDLAHSWQRAANEYLRCAKRYRRAHRCAHRMEASREYVLQDLFGNISPITHIEKCLDMLVANGERLVAEAHAREAMLRGASAETKRSRHAELPVSPGKADERFEVLHELEKERGVYPFRHADILESMGPYELRFAHFDGVPTPHTFRFYILRNKKSGIRSMWVASLDRFLFTKVWDPRREAGGASKTPYVYSGGLTASDTPYWYEPAGHLYVMRDPSYWMDVAAYADLERRPRLDRDAVVAQRSSLFELMLGACEDDLRIFIRHTKRRGRTGTLGSYSLLYGLLMRTHPALLFLTFNSSVWRLEESPRFIGESWRVSESSPYENESTVLETASTEDLVKVMSAQALREQRERDAGYLDED